MAAEAEDARHQLIDVVSNFDDVIMEKYLAEEPITADDLRRALRTATLAAEVVPILCGSAFKNKGVQPMLDAVIDYLPSPLDLPPTEGIRPNHPEDVEVRKADDAEPFSALAFKIMTDPYVGKLTYIRVYSGTPDQGRLGRQLAPRTRRSGSAASSRCTPTTARTRTPSSPATSWPLSA